MTFQKSSLDASMFLNSPPAAHASAKNDVAIKTLSINVVETSVCAKTLV